MQRSIRFPDDLDARIAKIAADEDRTFSYVVVRAMERAFGDATGDRIPERPAPPRSSSPDSAPRSGRATLAQYDRAIREGQQAALARQQALNKPKGI